MSESIRSASNPAMEELKPVLAWLRRSHDVLPFMGELIPATEAEFVPMPEEMVDIIAANGDFTSPERGSGPVWLDMINPDGEMFQLVLIRPRSDGELWVIAPGR